MLDRATSVQVTQLAEAFGVSRVTARADLDALVDGVFGLEFGTLALRTLIIKDPGGAVFARLELLPTVEAEPFDVEGAFGAEDRLDMVVLQGDGLFGPSCPGVVLGPDRCAEQQHSRQQHADFPCHR